jgi:hypothetical protein
MVNEVIQMIAYFGEFPNRKGDGMPGPQTIWIGLQSIKDFVLALKAMPKSKLTDTG